MSTEAPPADLTFQFRHFIRGLCDLLADYIERDSGAASLIVTIINRLCRRGDRRIAILARFTAGTLRPPRRNGGERAQPGCARAPDPVPRCRAYLVRLLKHEAAVYGRILEILLADPEMVALLAASPQAGRLLRPLWRMLSPRRYPPVLQPLPRDVASGASGAARACPPATPAPPCSWPELIRVSRDPVRAVRRSGFDPPIPA